MRLTQIIRSNPVKHFDAVVIHSTPRYSTPIEWFIIGAALTLEDNPDFANVSIEEFISRIGEVSDVSPLVKRNISNLMNVGALEFDSSIVGENVDLSKIPMSQLKVTENGRKMHQDEKLPGIPNTEKVKVDMDILSGEIHFHDDSVNYDTQCSGINVCSDINLGSIRLPATKVSQLLQKEQLEKEPTFSWLNAGSNIQDIEDCTADDSISWVNQPCILNISGNGMVTADMDDAMTHQVLDMLAPSVAPNVPKRSGIDFDTDVEKVSTLKETAPLAQNLMLNNRIYVRNVKLMENPIRIPSEKNGKKGDKPKKEIKTLINYGAEVFALDFDKNSNSLQVNIPASEETDVLFGSTAFATETRQMDMNRFDISVGDTTREMVLNYVPKSRTFSTNNFVANIAKTYGKEHLVLLNLLIMSRQTPLFHQMVHDFGCAITGIKNRVQFLREVTESNRTYVERSYLSPKQESDILFDNWIDGNLSTEEAYNLVKELDSESYIRNNPDRMAYGFDHLLDHWTIRENPELFWDIIKTAGKTQAMQAHLATPEVTAKLYTEQHLEQLFAKFGQIPPDIKSFFPAETGLLEIQKAYVKLSSKLNSIGLKPGISELEKRSIAMNNAAVVKELNVMVKNLNEMLKKLRGLVKDMDRYANQSCPQFFEMILTLNDVGEWIAPYLDADVSNFDGIYVGDTCAFMRCPQIVENEKFKDGRNALIIPKVVISELDGLKESSNDATAKKARDAIKAINSVMGKNWCFTEDSHPELLPADYPAETNGQRNNDNLILSVALHYLLHKPIMLMADNNFKNKALSEKISCINAKDFVDRSAA